MGYNFKVILYIGLLTSGQTADIKDFESPVLYNVEWPGSLTKSIEEYEKEGYESMIVTTEDQEQYRCLIPPPPAEKARKDSDILNLSPLKALSPLFQTKICSYRFENYWSYELCHGSHIKQYHEERDGKNIKVQEYFLGMWDETKMKALEQQVQKDIESEKAFKTTKIDNIKYPYFEIEMSDGTNCDLINQPRVTRVRYICYPQGKNEIFSFKETSTCNYEMIVLTSVLCMLPAFLPETSIESDINCIPLDDAPEKPLGWLKNKVEDLEMRYKHGSDGTLRVDIISPKQDEKLINPEMKETDEEVTPANDLNTGNEGVVQPPSPTPSTPALPPRDLNPILSFLRGDNCLTGGSGWWQYEFCYGKYIRQFHDKTFDKKSLILGYFHENVHRQWLDQHPQKRPHPKEERTFVTHFYSDGTICDKTGEKRQAEVKLKCGGSNTLSSSALSMFLLEPEICKYVLTIESKLICDILKDVDEDGLILDINSFASKLQQEDAISRSVNIEMKKSESISSDSESKTDSSTNSDIRKSGGYTGSVVVDDADALLQND